MTHQLDVAYNRQLSVRWCMLAERRLNHLTELFESGRWARYYSERSLLENIREAKNAVNIWRALSRGERLGQQVEIEVSIVESEAMQNRPKTSVADLPEVPAQPIELVPSIDLAVLEPDIFAEEEIVVAEPEFAAPHIDMLVLEKALSSEIDRARSRPPATLEVIENRYPALRHTL
jgi:uncharacterized repeat protein (TIGR03809 family)